MYHLNLLMHLLDVSYKCLLGRKWFHALITVGFGHMHIPFVIIECLLFLKGFITLETLICFCFLLVGIIMYILFNIVICLLNSKVHFTCSIVKIIVKFNINFFIIKLVSIHVNRINIVICCTKFNVIIGSFILYKVSTTVDTDLKIQIQKQRR